MDYEKLKAEIRQEIREEMQKINTPTVTKEDILNIENKAKRQKAIRENLNLFE